MDRRFPTQRAKRNRLRCVCRGYYISSLPLSVKQFATSVRGDWGIENSLHWCLDVTFRKDENRVRNQRFPASVVFGSKCKDSLASVAILPPFFLDGSHFLPSPLSSLL
jgi:predicted transposase YbfD/YdcC